MDCNYCHGMDTIKQQKIRFCACNSPTPFIVDNVPAEVCSLCGDKSYSGDTLAQLKKVRDRKIPMPFVLPIPIVDFDQIAETHDSTMSILAEGTHPIQFLIQQTSRYYSADLPILEVGLIHQRPNPIQQMQGSWIIPSNAYAFGFNTPIRERQNAWTMQDNRITPQEPYLLGPAIRDAATING